MFRRVSNLLARRPMLRRIVTSTGWLVADRGLRMVVGLFVGVWVARYMGPSDFGLFNYALTLVALTAVAANLGLDRFTVRELVRDADRAGEILSTTLILRAVAGLASAGLAVGVVFAFEPGNVTAQALVCVLAATSVFAAADTADLYFQSRTSVKYAVWARYPAFVLASAARVWLVLAKAPIVAFAWVQLAEAALVALGLWVALRAGHDRPPGAWRFAAARAKRLLADSWPQILNTVAIVIYVRIDQVMLRALAGEREVGIYSAAVRLSEVWYFVPGVLVAAVFPTILRVRETDERLYYHRMLQLFALVSAIGLTLSVGITIFAGPIVRVLFGPDYAAAAPVLALHTWATVFAFLGSAQEPWNVAEGFVRKMFYRTALGAAINVGLNFLLIPRYGAVGAAWATIVAYAYGAVIGNLFHRDARRIFWLQLKSLAFPLYLKLPCVDPSEVLPVAPVPPVDPEPERRP